jgi:hypothetical protein
MAIQGNVNYQKLVIPVINDAHLLAIGEKDYFTINRDNYYVISFLVEADSDYFKQIDIDQLSNADYSRILQYVNKQRDVFLA